MFVSLLICLFLVSLFSVPLYFFRLLLYLFRSCSFISIFFSTIFFFVLSVSIIIWIRYFCLIFFFLVLPNILFFLSSLSLSIRLFFSVIITSIMPLCSSCFTIFDSLPLTLFLILEYFYNSNV